MEIFVLGSDEVVTALSLAGLPGQVVAGKTALHQALAAPELAEQVRVLVVEEAVARLDREEFDRLKLASSGPLIVEIPGIRGPLAERRTPLEVVRHALGISLKES